jgi:hypothetical protein
LSTRTSLETTSEKRSMLVLLMMKLGEKMVNQGN